MPTARKAQLLRILHAIEQRIAHIESRLLDAKTADEINEAIETAASLQISLDDIMELIRQEPPEDGGSEVHAR